MLIAGAVLLLVASGLAYWGRSAQRSARRMTATETLPCGDIAALAQGVAGEVGGGSFRQRCEVVGTAEPGPGGALKAPESGQEVVWHRTEVTQTYWEMERTTRDGKTERRRVEKSEVVSSITSTSPFSVRDDSGTVLIAPEGADVDAPEHALDRFERAGPESGSGGLSGALVDLLLDSDDSGTIGFQHEEWVIRPGRRLYVMGEVSDSGGQLMFTDPAEGKFQISTRSEEELVKGAQRTAKLATAGAAVAGVAGVALLIAGALA